MMEILFKLLGIIGVYIICEYVYSIFQQVNLVIIFMSIYEFYKIYNVYFKKLILVNKQSKVFFWKIIILYLYFYYIIKQYYEKVGFIYIIFVV